MPTPSRRIRNTIHPTVAPAPKYAPAPNNLALLDAGVVVKEALKAGENDGIVFRDEIDKIVSSSDHRHGADASSEGDLLREQSASAGALAMPRRDETSPPPEIDYSRVLRYSCSPDEPHASDVLFQELRRAPPCIFFRIMKYVS